MAPAEVATTTSGGVEAAGRMSSMEREPKTLTLDQIKYAREAALYVMSTKTEEEAIRIFTEGLKPVQMKQVTAAAVTKSSSFDSSSDDDVDLGGSADYSCTNNKACGGGKGGRAGAGHRRRCRRHRSVDIERDVATAPF